MRNYGRCYPISSWPTKRWRAAAFQIDVLLSSRYYHVSIFIFFSTYLFLYRTFFVVVFSILVMIIYTHTKQANGQVNRDVSDALGIMSEFKTLKRLRIATVDWLLGRIDTQSNQFPFHLTYLCIYIFFGWICCIYIDESMNFCVPPFSRFNLEICGL